jgi:hypothetical protein
VDITVYLPDELGAWAKEHHVNFSGLLRGEVDAERTRQQAAAKLGEKTALHLLDVEDKDGRFYTARFHGTPLHEALGECQAFMGDDGQVWIYNDFRQSLWCNSADSYTSNHDALRECLSDDELIEAMSALGEAAVIDIGQA